MLEHTKPIKGLNQEHRYTLDPFQPTVVSDFDEDLSGFQGNHNYPSKHYNQKRVRFEPAVFEELFERLSIEREGRTVTVFGGYTGEYAECLRKVGFEVIFTDPIKEFVERAREKGFESYQYFASELTEDIIGKSNLFSTFECYQAVQMSNMLQVHNVLRMLSSPSGIVFAESERTRSEVDREAGGKCSRLKSTLRPLEAVYSTKRKYREKKEAGLRLYHIFQEEYPVEMATDCQVIKLLYENCDHKEKIGPSTGERLSERCSLTPEEIMTSFKRLVELNREILRDVPLLPPYLLNVSEKVFRVNT